MSASEDWPPKFELDREKILDLLTGDRFYSNASASLREAILNALDATFRRSEAESTTYRPRISVTFDQSQLRLTVEDNGDGMGRAEVKELFTTIGASAAELHARGNVGVGEFGIGVVSYFMSSDVFEIETCNGDEEPLGLRFRKEMYAGGAAEEFSPDRTSQGTTLRLDIRNQSTFELLLAKYPYWCRDVPNLTAALKPGNEPVLQGGDPHTGADSAEVSLPEGIEAASLRPVASYDGWNAMTGASDISILYRGIFVQDYTADSIWGMQGSVHVDPKHFKPRLNREGFVGDEFKSEIDEFLRSVHPRILSSLADLLQNAFDQGTVSKWDEHRWATLWLSVPRNEQYKMAAERWDNAFRRLPAFEFFSDGRWKPTTVDTLVPLTGPIWVAPQAEASTNDLVRSATRLLRETGKPVVRGLSRQRNWLRGAGNYFSTTADLIKQVFADELPQFREIAPRAEELLEDLDALYSLYGGDEPVELVRLGSEGPPVLKVARRLLINLDHEKGTAIATSSLTTNRGRSVLIEATAAHAPKYLTQVASIARPSESEPEILGLVKRRFLLEIVE